MRRGHGENFVVGYSRSLDIPDISRRGFDDFTNQAVDPNLSHTVMLRRPKEGPTATLAINSFNVLNHENDITYVGVITSPFFGRPVSAQPGRRMQLDLQFKF